MLQSVGVFPAWPCPVACGVLRMLTPGVLGLRRGGQPRVKEAGRSEFLEVLAGCPQTQLRVELEDLRKRGTVKGQSDGGGY